MARLNRNYQKLPKNYLFSEISKKTRDFLKNNPGIEVLSLGIGNTTEPLPEAVLKGLEEAVEKLGKVETYTGYGDELGNSNLRGAISRWYGKRGIKLMSEEIYISDGAKSDCANISSIFAPDSVIAITDPVYPVYLEANIISGKRIVFLEAKEENGFIPEPPRELVDLIFVCSPNNPTGSVATKEQLKRFVDYCLKNKAILIFDAAYSEYIQDKDLPRSIYEIDGATRCAIEIQSFSKSAGFTGVRLGWSVVPVSLAIEEDAGIEVKQLWGRRQTTMFNGASNIAQEGGLAVLSDQGQSQTKEQVRYYMENAKIIKEGLEKVALPARPAGRPAGRQGLKVFGGENAPYLWVKCPDGISSWEFFDKLLKEAHVTCTPGVGFGSRGEGYVRFSSFGHRENIEKAVSSIKQNLHL